MHIPILPSDGGQVYLLLFGILFFFSYHIEDTFQIDDLLKGFFSFSTGSDAHSLLLVMIGAGSHSYRSV